MNYTRKNQGITLVALIVTIIVLLILAGAVINMAVGADGIFSKASDAVNAHNNAVAREQQILEELFDAAENYGDDIEIPEGTVARVKSNFFESVQDAIDYCNTNTVTDPVILLVDQYENIEVMSGTTTNFNLNNYRFSGNINVEGELSVKNGSLGAPSEFVEIQLSIAAGSSVLIKDSSVYSANINCDGEFQFEDCDLAMYNITGTRRCS